MKRLLILLLAISSLGNAMELPEINRSILAPQTMIKLINNDDDEIEMPLAAVCKCDLINRMHQNMPHEKSFLVGDLYLSQLHFIKNYLSDLTNNPTTPPWKMLNELNVEQLVEGLKAANFLHLKPKKPIIQMLTAKLLSLQQCKSYLQKGTCSIDLPEEMLVKIRKQYAQYSTLDDLLIKAQLIKNNGKLPFKALNRQFGNNFVQYNPSGSHIAQINNNSKSVAIIDLSSEQIQWFSGHNRKINTTAWSPCGKMLATASKDRTIKIWNSTGQNCIATWPAPSDSIIRLAWNPKGNSIAFAAKDNKDVFLADIESGNVTHAYDAHPVTVMGSVTDLKWDYEGVQLASAGSDGALKIYDIRAPATTDIAKIWTSATCLAWKPQSKCEIAVGKEDGTVAIKNLLYQKYNGLQDRLFDHKISRSNKRIHSVDWHPTQHLIASGDYQEGIHIWDTDTLTSQHSLPANLLRMLTWNPNGSELAVETFGGAGIWHCYDKELKKDLLHSLTPEEMILQHIIVCRPNEVDISAPQLQKTWNIMHPLMQKTLINTIPYNKRFMSWIRHSIAPSMQNINIGCNPNSN